MIQGYFGSKGELFFEIDLIAADGSGIPEILIGLQWLEIRRLVVDRKAGILTLE